MTDEVFKREELDGETYDRHMNPEKHEKDLNVYEILTQIQRKDRSNQQHLNILNFLRQVYPLNMIEDFNLSEVYQYMKGRLYTLGEKVKDYGEITGDVCIVFSGEV